jgi:multiple sugar transport system substrate-binding protein
MVMRGRAIALAAVLILTPLGARGADLVVWWDKGWYAQEEEAVEEIVAAFEQKTGKEVELSLFGFREIFDQAQVAIAAGQPPDFLWGNVSSRWLPQWAYEDRLVDLQGVLGSLLDLFDADTIEAATLLNGRTGQRRLYALPMGRSSSHIHVWNSLLQQAGFTLADIPMEWAEFWSFWCDEVQPAVRRATGRTDIWGVGLSMATASVDTLDQFIQFQLAYEAPWVGSDGRLQVDDPEVREGMIEALHAYTSIWRKGCTPPESASETFNNNNAFIAQTVVMTPNSTLSIPGALKRQRPDDYYKNAVTIDWPKGANGRPLVIEGFVSRAVVFQAGANPALAGEFVRFLVGEGWLAHWMTFAGDRFLPPMRKLVEQPFWLDTSDPHRMRAAVQILQQPHQIIIGVRDKEWLSHRVDEEWVWPKAVHRVAAEGVTPEQAVDEAIARIKQILDE